MARRSYISPYLNQPRGQIVTDRAPTSNDIYNVSIGDFWLDTSNDIWYILTSLAANSATWSILIETPASNIIDTVETSDATETTLTSIELSENQTISINGRVNGQTSDYSSAIVAEFFAGAVRGSGNIALIGTPVVNLVENAAGSPSVTVDVDTSSQTLRVRVTGEAGTDYDWSDYYQYTIT